MLNCAILGLGVVYYGLESGDAQVLQDVNKGHSPERMIEAGRKIRAAGMKLSVMVILGLAGRERSLEHARATGEALSSIDPNYVGVLTLMIYPGTQLAAQVNDGRFELLTPHEMLKELREMLSNTNMTRGLFFANHASNYLPLRVKMPADKEKAIQALDSALNGADSPEARMDERVLNCQIGGAIVTSTRMSVFALRPCGSEISEIRTFPGLAGKTAPLSPRNSPSPSSTAMLTWPSISCE